MFFSNLAGNGKQIQNKGAHFREKTRLLLRCFCEDVPALNAALIVAIDRNTAQAFYAALRQRVVALSCEEGKDFLGNIEIDESCFGPKRVRGKRGRGASGKIPVLGLHKRQGKVFVSVVKNCSSKELMPIIKGMILEGSDIYTDGWKACDGLVTSGYKHHRVYHHENEFVRGRSHVNGIESFWSFAKSHFNKLRGVRRDAFFVHLKEAEWRFNHREGNMFAFLLKLLRDASVVAANTPP
jgi:transposase-like protein